eukprot:TRINITY_DN55437_c0_g1_i1.p2 TRINITY_DN55437_c0_g1~~TRINITY_DN55437_c0_g1_i1.p2  ORF type:complete len:251 (+),score=86.16 TRINITY_DN55437_c0_g1_i1:321-1073(+)
MSMLGLTPAGGSVASSSSSKTERATKRKKEDAAAKEEDVAGEREMMEVVSLVGRLCLSTASKADAAMGILTDIAIIGDGIPQQKEKLADMMKTTMRQYAEAASKLKPAEKAGFGPPHLRAWDTLLQYMKQVAEALNEAETVEFIDRHVKEVAEITDVKARAIALGDAIRYCCVKKTHNKDTVKIEVCINATEEIKHAKRCWLRMRIMMAQRLRADIRHGKAPASALQRKTLNKMKELGMIEDSRARQDDV